MSKEDGSPRDRDPSREPPASSSPPAGPEGGSDDPDLLEQLRCDLDGAKDRLLRSQAELENYRKRAAREIEDHRRYANLPLLRDLLPVLDNLERSMAAAEQSPDVAGLLTGVRLVAKQLEDVLAKHQCVRIPALHQPFDPNLHHALLQQPSGDFPPHTVLAVTEAGFQLHDRVVRPAQVIVSAAKDAEVAD
jgi:molecular chaperone GrpE